MKTELVILVNGTETKEKVREQRFSLTALFTKELFSKIKNGERVFLPGQINNLFMMASGETTNFKDRVNYNGMMGESILDNFIMINLMEMVS